MLINHKDLNYEVTEAGDDYVLQYRGDGWQQDIIIHEGVYDLKKECEESAAQASCEDPDTVLDLVNERKQEFIEYQLKKGNYAYIES